MILHPLSQPCHCLSAKIWSLSAHPILSMPRNHAFTIKTSASYLEKSLWMSKLLISALEIHRHFVAFNCPPFCLLFSKPTSTISFGKFWLSIIFSLITSYKLFLDREITLTTNEKSISRATLFACLLWVVPWVPRGIDKCREQQPRWVRSHMT